MQKPDLAMPWPAWYELDGRLPATVALSVPSSVLPEQLPLYVHDIKNRAGAEKGPQLSLSLQRLEPQYGREVIIRDMAERITHALAAGADRIDVPLPFTVKRVGDELVKQPQEMLIILRTLLTTLGGTTFRGKVPIAEDVEAYLFDRDGTDSATVAGKRPSSSYHAGQGMARSGFCTSDANSP